MVFTVLNKVTSLVNFNFKNLNINQLFFFGARLLKLGLFKFEKKSLKGCNLKLIYNWKNKKTKNTNIGLISIFNSFCIFLQS